MKCSICDEDFDETTEGMSGEIGLISMGLCAVCNAGIVDYVFQCYGTDDEDKMGPGVMIVPVEVLNELVQRDYDGSEPLKKRVLN